MKEKKPVYLFVTPFFPRPESWRGAFCYDFVKALMRQGKYDVRVFVHWRKGDGSPDDYEYHGIKVCRFRFRRAPFGIAPFLFSLWNRKSFQKKVEDVGIAWEDIAVYHAHELLFAPFIENVSTSYKHIVSVLHFHNMGHPFHVSCGHLGFVPLYSEFLYLWMRKHFERIDMPTFVSKRQQGMFGKWYPHGYLNEAVDVLSASMFRRMIRPIKLKKSYVCYNGIDYTVFNAIGRSVSTGVFTIGCVANICESKDQLTLLRALVRLMAIDKLNGLSNWKCIFVGSGDKLPVCKQFVSDNGLENIVEFRTEMDHLELPDFYRSLDLFVLPSWAEGFSCAYVEAFGSGTPIMGCKGVSVEEAIPEEDRERWLFSPQNAAELASKIYAYYSQRYKQRLVQNFDIDSLVGEFLIQVENRMK